MNLLIEVKIQPDEHEIPFFNTKDAFFGWQMEDNIVFSNFIKELYNNPNHINYNLYQAISYEYGILSELNLRKSYEFYCLSAFTDKNPFAYYYLHQLHKFDAIGKYAPQFSLTGDDKNALYQIKKKLYFFEDEEEGLQFSCAQRDRELELYYLLCSVAYLPVYYKFLTTTWTLRGINPIYTLAYYLDVEDKKLENTKYLLNKIVPNNMEKFNTNQNEIMFIETILDIKFLQTETTMEFDKILLNDLSSSKYYKPYINLLTLADKNFVHAIGALGYLSFNSEDFKLFKTASHSKAETYYSMLYPLYEKKSSNAVCFINDNIDLLFFQNKFDEALELCEIGIKYGHEKCSFLKYDLELIKCTNVEDFNYFLGKIPTFLKLLIHDICYGGIYSIYEYLNLHRILSKYLGIVIKKYDITQSLHNLLIKKHRKEICWVLHDQSPMSETEAEFDFDIGFLNYMKATNIIYKLTGKMVEESEFQKLYNIKLKDHSNFWFLKEQALNEEGKIEETTTDKDCLSVLNTSIIYFDKCYQNSKSQSYKRFILSYLVKALLKKERLLEIINSETGNAELQFIISDRKKHLSSLESIYKSSTENLSLNYFSSSFFYQLGKLIMQNEDTSKDNELSAIKYFLLGKNSNFHIIGNGSNICFFRRLKISKILNDSVRYNILISELSQYKGNYTEECDICFENKKTVIIYPCKHFVCCNSCFMKILYTLHLCPICRGDIIAYA